MPTSDLPLSAEIVSGQAHPASDVRKIRSKGLEENLPADSQLRAYLADKRETGVNVPGLQPQRLVRYCAPLGPKPRCLLIMPPMRLFEGAVKRMIPPLGLCYIAAALEQRGYPCEVLDCLAQDTQERQVAEGVWQFGMAPEAFRDYIRASDFQVFGLSMIYSSDLGNLYDYAQIIREEKPAAVIVAGGIHATIYAEQFLRDSLNDAGQETINFVLRGEGEHRFADLLDTLAEGMIDAAADGLAGWLHGQLLINPQREVITDLDALPFPAYQKVDLEKYFEHNVPFSPYSRGKRVMQIYTSRGCPVSCTFCASTNFAKSYRARSVENVMAEIDYYIAEYGIDEIQFADDNLTFQKERSFKLFSELKKRNLHWCTPNGIMVNTLTEELLELMIASGLYQITLSLDSGSAETLQLRHRKPVNLGRIADLMAFLEGRDVLMHGTLVVGMPGETREAMHVGFDFVAGLPFHSINVFIAQAIPGSELFEKSIAAGIMTYREALHIDTARSIVQLSTVPNSELEGMVSDFLITMNERIRARDPAAWDRKYGEHLDRMKDICVGQASAITQTILDAGRAVARPVPVA